MSIPNVSQLNFCPDGYHETFVKGKPETYKDFRKMPYIKCEKGKKAKAVTPPPKKDATVTLHNFGFVGSTRYSKITNAQGYIEKIDPKTNAKKFVRHYQYPTSVGKSEYGKFSTLTYKLPDKRRIYADVSTKYDEEGRGYFITDTSVKNVYCQPFEPITLPLQHDGDNSQNYTCISGNVRMLNRNEAKKVGFDPHGSFRMWRDMSNNPAQKKEKT